MKNRLLARTALALLAGVALALISVGSQAFAGPKPTAKATTAGSLGFAPPVYVSQVLGGGEPFVLQSTKFGSLVFSAHEGTTLL